MNYDWYKICNKDEFDALNVVSKSYEFFLDPIGLKTIVVTKGNYYSFIYEGIFLSYNINGRNPFEFGGCAIIKDVNNDFYLGVTPA